MSTHDVYWPLQVDVFVAHESAHEMPSDAHPKLQDIVIPALQVPAPLHFPAAVATPDEQLAAAPHAVAVVG